MSSADFGGVRPIFALPCPTEGVPSLRLQGRVAVLTAQTLVRLTLPVVYAVVVPVLATYAKDGAPQL